MGWGGYHMHACRFVWREHGRVRRKIAAVFRATRTCSGCCSRPRRRKIVICGNGWATMTPSVSTWKPSTAACNPEPDANSNERSAYRHMEEFIGSVADADAADQLGRAIRGKGAFRYFKDTLHRLGLQDQGAELEARVLPGSQRSRTLRRNHFQTRVSNAGTQTR